jgi:DNA primase
VDQLRVLRRFTDAVIACFDGDEAGRRAAARSFPLFLEAGLWGKGVFLPAGDDPDSFVRTHGATKMEERLATAEPLVEAFVTQLGGPSRDAVGRRADAAKEVARILKRVRNPLEFGVLAHIAADSLGVREDVLRTEGAPEASPVPAVVFRPSPGGAELMLVELMAEDAEIARRVADSGIIPEFEHPEWRRTAESLAAAGGESDRLALVQALPREIRDRIVSRLLAEGPDAASERERALADCIAAVRSRGRRGRLRQVREGIRAAEARGDTAAVAAGMRELKSLMDEAHEEKART